MMATPEQGKNAAFNLIDHAAELLDAIGETAAALRLRHSLATIRNDWAYPEPHDELKVPLSLMRMALALIDGKGRGASAAACALQEAIDHARDARPLRPGEEIDPALCPPFDLDDGPQSAG